MRIRIWIRKEPILVLVTTDGLGNYSFAGLMPGAYVVFETQPLLYSSISDHDTSITSTDLDGDDQGLGPNNLILIVVSPGEMDMDNNFENGRPGSISGVVEDDLGNPLSNIKIWLYVDVDGDGNPDGAPN